MEIILELCYIKYNRNSVIKTKGGNFMLWTEYYVYLMGLSEPEREKQILLLISFFVITILIGIVSKLIKDKKHDN